METGVDNDGIIRVVGKREIFDIDRTIPADVGQLEVFQPRPAKRNFILGAATHHQRTVVGPQRTVTQRRPDDIDIERIALFLLRGDHGFFADPGHVQPRLSPTKRRRRDGSDKAKRSYVTRRRT